MQNRIILSGRSGNKKQRFKGIIAHVKNYIIYSGNSREVTFMNLLAYTKKLYEKISAYDRIAKNPYTQKGASNPFYKPQNVTIVWVDKKDCN